MEAERIQVGKVIHYFPKIGVAIIEISEGSIKIGNEIQIKGHTSDFTQKVESMQIEHENVEIAIPGHVVALKVKEPARANDLVIKSV